MHVINMLVSCMIMMSTYSVQSMLLYLVGFGQVVPDDVGRSVEHKSDNHQHDGGRNL